MLSRFVFVPLFLISLTICLARGQGSVNSNVVPHTHASTSEQMPWRFGSTEPPASEYVEAAFPERLVHTLREHQSLIRDAKERGVSLPLESLTYVEGRAPTRHPPLRVSFDFVKPHTKHVGETAPLALLEAAIAADRIAAKRARNDHHDQVYVPQLMQEYEEAAKTRTPKEARRQYLARMKKVQEIRKS